MAPDDVSDTQANSAAPRGVSPTARAARFLFSSFRKRTSPIFSKQQPLPQRQLPQQRSLPERLGRAVSFAGGLASGNAPGGARIRTSSADPCCVCSCRYAASSPIPTSPPLLKTSSASSRSGSIAQTTADTAMLLTLDYYDTVPTWPGASGFSYRPVARVFVVRKQFFESINPTGDFDENSDALESYLYDRSLKIQPKDQDKPANEAKPRHPPHVMRSPGIRPPKQQQQHHERGMSFASSFTSFGSSSGAPGGASSATLTPGNTYTPGAQTAPPTPSYDQDGPGHRSARQPVLHQSSQEDTQSAGHFTLSDIPRGTREHGKAARQTQRAGMVPPPAVSLGHSPTPPPPLQPRKVSRAAGLPMGNAPPPLYPRRATKAGVAAPAQATSPTSTPSPATTSPATTAKSPDDHHQPSRPALETPAAGLVTSPSTSSSQPSSATSAAAAPPPSFFFPSSPPLPSNTSSVVSPPAIPPRRPASTLSTPHTNSTNTEAITSPTSNAALTSNGTESLRVVLDRPPSGSPPEAVSPTVSLSVPLPPSSTPNPPALPPRRSALQQQPPPPLPPKPGQHQQLSPGASLSPPPPPLPAPSCAGSSTNSAASAPAPPIPPKTYKQRKHSPTTR